MMLLMFCLALQTVMPNTELAQTPYPAPESRYHSTESTVFYQNDFDHYPENATPWFGNGFDSWSVQTSRISHTGSKILLGESLGINPGEHRWAVSERFSLDDSTRHISVHMYARFWNGKNVWQIVPQGADLIACRLIVDVDGRIHILDALSPDLTPVPTGAYLDPFYLNGLWEEIEFKIDRQTRYLQVFFNGQRIHTGQVFTAELETLALTMDMNAPNVYSHLDTVRVTADNFAVPALQPWALLALLVSLTTAALFLRRKHRPHAQRT